MTDEQKLCALYLCEIQDVYKYAHDAEWAHHLAEETQKRVMFLEHALLRLLSEIERKHELGKSVRPESIEAQTAWKLLKEPRYT